MRQKVPVTGEGDNKWDWPEKYKKNPDSKGRQDIQAVINVLGSKKIADRRDQFRQKRLQELEQQKKCYQENWVMRLQLKDTDLSGLELSGVDLRHAELTRANLIGSSLNQANLKEAELTRANLTDLVYRYADFTDTEKTGAIWPKPDSDYWKRKGARGDRKKTAEDWGTKRLKNCE